MRVLKTNAFVRIAAASFGAAGLLAAGLLSGCAEGEGGGAPPAARNAPANSADDGEYQPQSTLGKAKNFAEETVEDAEEYNEKLMRQIEEGIDAEDE